MCLSEPQLTSFLEQHKMTGNRDFDCKYILNIFYDKFYTQNFSNPVEQTLLDCLRNGWECMFSKIEKDKAMEEI